MIRRILPPTVAPIYLRDILNGLKGALRGEREVDRFNGELRDYFGVRHCFTLSSGRAALTVILRALHVLSPERKIVIIPAYTCYSVAASVVRAGLSIRLCDVDSRTLDFNYDELQNIIAHNSNEILAVIPVHLFGLPSDMERLKNITSGHDIFIIEDAAQAFGGKDSRGNKLGTKGDVGFFSLGRGKPITTAGGGIVITDRSDIARGIEEQVERIGKSSTVPLIVNALFLALFIYPRLYWFPKGLPFLKIGETIYDDGFDLRRLSAFQAGLAKGWRGKLEFLKQTRRKRALNFLAISHWNGFYSYVSDSRELPDLLRFPILLRKTRMKNNPAYRKAMDSCGIVPSYPTSIQDIEELRDRFKGEKYPGADQVSAHLVTLPVHSLVSEEDTDKIITLLESQ